MTAPVTQEYIKGKWQVRFIMPSQYDLQTLPIPNSPAIKIEKVPAKQFVVIRFSGIPSDNLLAEKLEKLKEFIRNKNCATISDPIYAFYNPPWTLPFMRRTEILIEEKDREHT